MIRALLEKPKPHEIRARTPNPQADQRRATPQTPYERPSQRLQSRRVWLKYNLILEFDGWQGHGHRHAFESNRKRDQIMLANGLRTLRSLIGN